MTARGAVCVTVLATVLVALAPGPGSSAADASGALVEAAATTPAESAEAAADPAAPAATSLRYAFYVRPGLSLHHFLYQWARSEGKLPGDRSPVPEMPERAGLAALGDEERAALAEAVAVYRRDALPHDLLFDHLMNAVNTSLAVSADSLDCGASDLAAKLEPALRSAWPVYERHWWPDHERRNREWIAALLPLLDRYERDATAELARGWGVDWPPERVRVDVTFYANWAGAYTTGEESRITLAAGDPGIAGVAGLEALLHEVSHIDAFEGANGRALARAFEAAGVPAPRGLWHVMIFYLAGDVVTRLVAAAGEPEYEPHGETSGLYDRVPGWREHARALARHWQPFLDGRVDRETALRRLAESYGNEE